MNKKYKPDYSNLDKNIDQYNLSSNELYILGVFSNPEEEFAIGSRTISKKEIIEYFAEEFEIGLQSMKRIFNKLEKLGLMTIVEEKVCSISFK